jgi:hypothetical protein
MEAGCPCCGGAPTTGVLCAACREAVPACDGLVPGHVSARAAAKDAAAWIIDAFGAPHALSAGRNVVGRKPEADLVILNASVSREHAELQRTDGGWQLRDLGSRNGTVIDGRRVQGRAPLLDRSQVRFGEVAFVFVGRPIAMPERGARSIETKHAGRGPFRFSVRGPAVDLCLVGSEVEDSEEAGGALLYRGRDAKAGASWSELSLPPLEFHLLRMLCARAVEDEGSPSRARGCVPTKQLAKKLPFQSKYANEENVRQVVRRVRASLDEIGADGLLEAVPGRGYYVAWPVVAG